MAKGHAISSAGGRCPIAHSLIALWLIALGLIPLCLIAYSLIAHNRTTGGCGHDDCVESIEVRRTVIQVGITLQPLFAADRRPVGGSRMQIGASVRHNLSSGHILLGPDSRLANTVSRPFHSTVFEVQRFPKRTFDKFSRRISSRCPSRYDARTAKQF